MTYISLIMFHVLIVVAVMKGDSMFGVLEWTIFALGALLASVGQIYFTVLKKWNGRVTKNEIWEGGPFKLVRHPFYGGLILICVALAVSSSKFYLPLVIFPGLVISMLMKISITQEKELIAIHGDEARRYFKKIKKRWLPFII